MTACRVISHHAITGLSPQNGFLTNFLSGLPLKQLENLTNVPYMILFLILVANKSDLHAPETHTLASSGICRRSLRSAVCELSPSVIFQYTYTT